MSKGPSGYGQRVIGALLLLAAIAAGARFVWEMLEPLIPAVVVAITLGVVYWLMFKRR